MRYVCTMGNGHAPMTEAGCRAGGAFAAALAFRAGVLRLDTLDLRAGLRAARLAGFAELVDPDLRAGRLLFRFAAFFLPAVFFLTTFFLRAFAMASPAHQK